MMHRQSERACSACACAYLVQHVPHWHAVFTASDGTEAHYFFHGSRHASAARQAVLTLAHDDDIADWPLSRLVILRGN